MRDLGPLDGDVEEIDGRGLSAIPGLVDCHTHPAFGGDRVDEFALRAGRRDLRGAPRGRRRDPLDRRRDARARRERRSPRRVDRHAGWMLAARHDDVGGQVGLRSRPRDGARVAAGDRGAGGSPTWLGRPRGPAGAATSADAYLDWALAEVLPDAARIADAADVFLERGAFDAAQARRYLEACRAAGLALRLHGDQFTECGAIPLGDRARRTLGRPPRGDRARRRRRARVERRRRRAAAGERAVPRPTDAAGAAPRRCGRGGGARDRLQSRQLVHDEHPARVHARVHAAPSLARGGAHRGHRQRSARPRPAVGSGGSRPGYAARPRPARGDATGVTSRTRSRATSSRRWSAAAGSRFGANLDCRCRPASSAAVARRTFRHEYETVLLDADGNERPLDDEELRAEREARAQSKAAAKAAARKTGAPGSAAVATHARGRRRRRGTGRCAAAG